MSVPRGRLSAHRWPDAAWFGLLTAVLLAAAAIALPVLTGWDVHSGHPPPLHAHWEPRVGPGSVPALGLAVVGVVFGHRVVLRYSWRRLLLLCWGYSMAWMLSLAFVDGVGGLTAAFSRRSSYLVTARGIDDVGAMLSRFISRIPLDSAHNWAIQVAGHPPGALLVFVFLDRIGLGSALSAGVVVTAVAATAPVAVLVTLRVLGAEGSARRVAPILVLCPAAIWCAVSGDGLFAAVTAWGLAALAVAAVRRSLAWSGAAGIVLGYCVMLSYGYVLLGILAIAVLVAARSAYPLVPAALAAIAVVLAFAAGGFVWWEAYPVLSARYWAGVASKRPASYWIWGDFAAFCFSAGPLAYSAIAHASVRVRRLLGDASSRPVLLLSMAAALTLVVADASQMSKGEVERIWLPFGWWMVTACALLPPRWRRLGLVLQVAVALALQHLLVTSW